MMFVLVCSFFSNVFFLTFHHVDNKEETITYINIYIDNTIVFIIDVHTSELEQKCMFIYRSSSHYEYRCVFSNFC
jgi:hypothetical protein